MSKVAFTSDTFSMRNEFSRLKPSDQRFVLDMIHELMRAREKFPDTTRSMLALMEEVGELAKAFLQDESEDDMHKEAVQVAVMAMRIDTEGDPAAEMPESQRKYYE